LSNAAIHLETGAPEIDFGAELECPGGRRLECDYEEEFCYNWRASRVYKCLSNAEY
jgi:hypothetical protein